MDFRSLYKIMVGTFGEMRDAEYDKTSLTTNEAYTFQLCMTPAFNYRTIRLRSYQQSCKSCRSLLEDAHVEVCHLHVDACWHVALY